jgi:diacylglycerol kinase
VTPAWRRSPAWRLGRRMRDAVRGAADLARTSANARIEAALGYLAVSAALAEGGAERVGLVLVASGAVLAAEGMNTALERAVDRGGLEADPLARAAKDGAAGAVLLAAAGAASAAVWVLVPHLAACLAAWHRASALARGAWLAGLAALAVGALWPEPPGPARAQGPR